MSTRFTFAKLGTEPSMRGVSDAAARPLTYCALHSNAVAIVSPHDLHRASNGKKLQCSILRNYIH